MASEKKMNRPFLEIQKRTEAFRRFKTNRKMNNADLEAHPVGRILIDAVRSIREVRDQSTNHRIIDERKLRAAFSTFDRMLKGMRDLHKLEMGLRMVEKES